MAASDSFPSRSTLRIDSQTTLSLALVMALVGGGIQYGKQSQRLENVERELIEIRAQLRELTTAITANGLHVSPQLRFNKP